MLADGQLGSMFANEWLDMGDMVPAKTCDEVEAEIMSARDRLVETIGRYSDLREPIMTIEKACDAVVEHERNR